MSNILVFDIETIPDISGLHTLGLIEETTVEATSAYMQKLKLDKGSDFLPTHLQKVVAISCVLRQDRLDKNQQPHIYVGSLESIAANEKQIIQKFFALIDKYQPQLVSWNGSGFDLPVLHYRALINQINAYQYWDLGERSDYTSKEFKWNNYINRYHLRHIDLMEMLAMFQSKLYAKLDDMAKLCGLPGKLGMDGSQVWTEYNQGNLLNIRNYCETDVVNTYLLYQKFNAMRYAKEEIFIYEKELLVNSLDKSLTHWQEYLSKLS